MEQMGLSQEMARRERLPLARVLIREGLVRSRDLAALLAMCLGLPMVDLRTTTIDPDAVAVFPEEIARRYHVLPVKQEDGRLVVAMVDPGDFQAVDDLSVRAGGSIRPVIATSEDILEHIDVSYRLIENLKEGPEHRTGEGSGTVTAGQLRTSPPARVIDLLLTQALQDRASDLHIEPAESGLRVRFRIDGILHDVMSLPMDMHATLLSRIKITAGMNIAERRRPQDGQISFEIEGRKVDVRVAISNTVLGEMVVLRILDKRFTLLGLDQLGMEQDVWDQSRRLLQLSHGMLVVCGPTGSGKSTTLYASLLQMNRTESNVISLEDPVEYHVTDTNQLQIYPDVGVTFASLLRGVLRLDPDVILVGEIRDQETALIATQAALTGHIVLTSIHANDAVSALLRLRDLGVAPYLIASSVAGIVSQRMCRVTCVGCRLMMPRPIAEQRAFHTETGEYRDQFVYGSGCNLCAQTGYRGRTGIFEVLTNSASVRHLFLEGASQSQLSEEAVAQGMIPIRKDGMTKVKEGITTPYEVMRVLSSLE